MDVAQVDQYCILLASAVNITASANKTQYWSPNHPLSIYYNQVVHFIAIMLRISQLRYTTLTNHCNYNRKKCTATIQ